MNRKQRILFGLLIAGHLALSVGDFALTKMNQEVASVLWPLPFGILLGQMTLLAMWLVLVVQPFMQRLLGVVFCCGFVWCFQQIVGGGFWTASLLTFIPLIASAAAMVLLLRWWRWQIVPPQEFSIITRGQFRLRELFLLLGMTCVLLAVGRGLNPELGSRSSFVWLEILFYSCAIATLMLMIYVAINLVGIWFVFDEETGIRGDYYGLLILTWLLLYAIVPTAIAWILIVLLTPIDSTSFVASYATNVSYLFTIAGTLGLLKQIGFTLDCGSKYPPLPSATKPETTLASGAEPPHKLG